MPAQHWHTRFLQQDVGCGGRNFPLGKSAQACNRNAPFLARPFAAADEIRADSSSQCMACETAIVACRGQKLEW